MTSIGYTFDGGYDRIGTVESDHANCTICSSCTKVMVVDNSQGEYYKLKICIPCINRILKEKTS